MERYRAFGVFGVDLEMDGIGHAGLVRLGGAAGSKVPRAGYHSAVTV